MVFNILIDIKYFFFLEKFTSSLVIYKTRANDWIDSFCFILFENCTCWCASCAIKHEWLRCQFDSDVICSAICFIFALHAIHKFWCRPWNVTSRNLIAHITMRISIQFLKKKSSLMIKFFSFGSENSIYFMNHTLTLSNNENENIWKKICSTDHYKNRFFFWIQFYGFSMEIILIEITSMDGGESYFFRWNIIEFWRHIDWIV